MISPDGNERYIERLDWFSERIGKIVWRPMVSCDCESCLEVYENGIKIHNPMHADYLCSMEGCDVVTKYFDTKEERDEFEKSQKK